MLAPGSLVQLLVNFGGSLMKTTRLAGHLDFVGEESQLSVLERQFT